MVTFAALPNTNEARLSSMDVQPRMAGEHRIHRHQKTFDHSRHNIILCLNLHVEQCVEVELQLAIAVNAELLG
jgi:hypothetical protein